MTKYQLNAETRIVIGSSVKKIRRQGLIPATIYGKDVPSLSLQIKSIDFNKVYGKAGETSVIWIKLSDETKERPVLVKNVTFSPTKGGVTHIDLYQVNLKEKVTAFVPVEVLGESEAIKSGVAVLDIHIKEVEVEALPTEIPEIFEFDISSLNEIGDHLSISSLKLSSGVEIKMDHETIVVSLSEPQKEEEALTPVVEAEVVGEEKKEDEATLTKAE